MTMNLAEAFDVYGAKPANRLRSLSAIAANGSLVLSCSHKRFGHPAPAVLRYEDRLSREAAEDAKAAEHLGRHLERAREEALPVRLVIVTTMDDKDGRRSRRIHVRPDLIGKLVKFDGDHFIVDFTRQPVEQEAAAEGRRR